MAHLLLANIPLRPEIRPKTSIQRSIDDQHVKFQSSLFKPTSLPQRNLEETRLIQSSTSSSGSSSSSKSSSEISMTLNNDEVEFFAVVKPNSSEKHRRKRDRIRSAFHRFESKSKTETKSDDQNWSEVFANALISVHRDIDLIITGLDEVKAEPIEPSSHLSFFEHQRAKFTMIRMTQLLSKDFQLSNYPYTDIVESRDQHLYRLMKQLPTDQHFVQHKPFQHDKCRYRIQKNLLQIRRDFRRLKIFLYGKKLVGPHQEVSSMKIHQYRVRLERNIIEVRRQMAEYDQMCSSNEEIRSNSRPTIDSEAILRIEDYRTKIRPIVLVDTDPRHQLISAPFIPRRRQRENLCQTNRSIEKDEENCPLFDDLQKKAEEFFGGDEPFWNRSSSLNFAVVSRLAVPIARAQQKSRESQEFYDCLSSFSSIDLKLKKFDRTSSQFYSIDTEDF